MDKRIPGADAAVGRIDDGATILLGGFVAPILWSGLLYTTLGILNPLLDKKIDWTWFVISQFGFGIVAGLVVSRQEKVFTQQNLPFAMRAGIEVPRSAATSDENPNLPGRPE